MGGEKVRTIKDHITHLNYFKGFLKLRNKAFTYLEQIDKKTCQKYIEYMLEEKVLYDDHQHITKDKKGLSPSNAV
ncbi:phage integrase SAM-like domain-containing protein [Bacillus solitudinis]|uniref:phage integrase SAM-like domain-containing protein n=1 Tax=Bacillus solitudinis TaxID=2014074 RepID=UPI0018E1FFBC